MLEKIIVELEHVDGYELEAYLTVHSEDESKIPLRLEINKPEGGTVELSPECPLFKWAGHYWLPAFVSVKRGASRCADACPHCQAIHDEGPEMYPYLSDEIRDHFDNVQRIAGAWNRRVSRFLNSDTGKAMAADLYIQAIEDGAEPVKRGRGIFAKPAPADTPEDEVLVAEAMAEISPDPEPDTLEYTVYFVKEWFNEISQSTIPESWRTAFTIPGDGLGGKHYRTRFDGKTEEEVSKKTEDYIKEMGFSPVKA